MREWLEHRWLHLVVATAVAVAVVGFFTGIRGEPESSLSTVPDETGEPEGARPRAPRYQDMTERHSPNRLRHPGALAAMAEDRPALTDPVTLDPEEKEAALEARAARRAYDGAPPVIPHAVDPSGSYACKTCHAEGMRVAGHVAPARSHGELQSCTECHVVANGPVPTEEPLTGGPPFADNSFEGLGSPGDGPRAFAGAPPQIPHRTFMREQCVSCHGVLGTGVRTSHPWRQACTQCHAPSAASDQRPAANLGPPAGGVQEPLP